jgi:hypothetical protein
VRTIEKSINVNIPGETLLGTDPHKLECYLRFVSDRHGIVRERAIRPWSQYHTSDDELLADDEQFNFQILQQWITTLDTSQRTLQAHPSSLLAEALMYVEVGNFDLLRCLKSYSGPLTMSIICNFPVTTKNIITANIPREVGIKYLEFGTHLLQDRTGAFIRSLEAEQNRNSELINQRILEQWLKGEGRPISWATLVEVLNIIKLGELAKQIEDKYVTAST